MPLKLDTSAFGTKVRITNSGEQGTVTGFCLHQRSKSSKQFLAEYVAGFCLHQRSKSLKQFLVEYVAADGRACAELFYEDQLSEI